MTTVNITKTENTVEVNETTNVVTVQQGATQTVEVITQGPQGITGQQGQTGPQGPPVSGFNFDGSAKVNKSVVYYDSTAGKFKADNTWTTSTLVFGGDF